MLLACGQESPSPSSAIKRPNPKRHTQTTQTFDRQLRFAKSRVIEFIKENRVDWVLIEYLTFAPIAFEIRKKIRPETQPVIAVDTHDLLHRRASDFRQHGFEHWIEINEAEEIAALKPFDQIVAIQEEEARFFTKHCDSHQSVIIATHPIKSLEHQPLESQTAEWDSALSNKIGYFASANRSNESAIVDFLTKVWPQVDSKFELIIAGNICQSERVNGALKDLEESISRRVKLIGRVATIQAFYDQVGIVINPVTFGTGLKIKNVEAIAMGKCLITTPAGQAGLTCDFVSQSWDVDKACYIAVSNDDEFSEALNRLAKETKIVQEISANALKFSQENLTAERVYRDLWRNIKERLSESRTD